MFKRHRICAVVPAYKEEDRIGTVIRTMPAIVDHIVVVDDASPDRTYEKALESRDERVTIVRHQKNRGVGGAIITGYKKAIELGAEISVVMAGDGQMDPEYLPDLLDAVIEEGFDYAKGNRFLNGEMQHMPRLRVLGNMILSVLTKFASGYWGIFDSQNGYVAVSTSTLRKLDLDHLAEGYQFENDMLVHLNLVDAKVKDVGIPARYDGEQSKIELSRFVPETCFFLTRRFFYRIRRKCFSAD